MKSKSFITDLQLPPEISNVVSGAEKSKKEVIVKLLTNTKCSKNFIALITNSHINYIHTINKQINTNQL